jgi:integrase
VTAGGALIVVPAKSGGGYYWEATWRHNGRAIKRRLGAAWIRPRGTPTDVKGWQGTYMKRPGNPTGGELTPQQAVVAMRDLIAEHAAAAATIPTRPRTFREAAHAWFDDPHERAHAWSPATARDYRSMLAEPGGAPAVRGRPHGGRLLAALGDKNVAAVTSEDVRRFLRGLDGKMAPRTVNKHRQAVGLILADAAARGWRGPAPVVSRRREPASAELAVFTTAQVESIAAAAGGELGALILVAGFTGLRRGELVALRWRDVRFEQPAIHVERAVSAGAVGRPKSGKGRLVPLAERPHAVLLKLSGRERWTRSDELVFPRADGGMRSVDAVSHAYVRARDAAGAPPLRFHDLRHTFGSLLAMSGVSAFEIQAWMGHSSAATTARYMHYAPRADAAARITAALRSGAP